MWLYYKEFIHSFVTAHLVIRRFLQLWIALLWSFSYVYWCTCARNPLGNTQNRVVSYVTVILDQHVLQSGCLPLYQQCLRHIPFSTFCKTFNFYNPVPTQWHPIGFDLYFSDYYWDWVSFVYWPFRFSLPWNTCFVSIAQFSIRSSFFPYLFVVVLALFQITQYRCCNMFSPFMVYLISCMSFTEETFWILM